jgi:hypothetical protein
VLSNNGAAVPGTIIDQQQLPPLIGLTEDTRYGFFDKRFSVEKNDDD